jgi:cation diffusion facilitator CzcD-associated flavoprotein CzcO
MGDSIQATSTGKENGTLKEYDAIVIGAGVAGLYQLYRLRQAGLSVRLYEDGSGVGGTWYWNRYPGCRFDSESESYGYSWSPELLQEWDWKEHYSGQPENERYLNFVADKFDLRRDIQFNSHVTSAVYDERGNRWDVELENGERAKSQFLVAATGLLSARYTPPFEGMDSFEGKSFHTSRWPKEPVDFKGKRVAVIGTGATGVQLIPEIAKEVGHLTVFQRTPNYCAPCRNSLVSPETQREWKANYEQIHKRIRETTAAFIHDFDRRKTLEVPKEERLAFYEELWTQPGFKKWLSNFYDIMIDPAANEDFAEFVRNKIRQRVKDPAVAEKLIPRDHPFGSKRIPLETGYYDAFNRDNVLLVDVREAPIERITPRGVKTTEKEYEFDIIIYATGFDAVTGSLTRMDIRGLGGQTIKDKWANGPRTLLGIQTAGFPNLFIAINNSFCNYTVCAESMVEWITNCIGYIREKGYKRIDATPQAENAWVEYINKAGTGSIFTQAKSAWFMGTNIPGKARAILLNPIPAPAYRAKCNEAAENGYREFSVE